MNEFEVYHSYEGEKYSSNSKKPDNSRNILDKIESSLDEINLTDEPYHQPVKKELRLSLLQASNSSHRLNSSLSPGNRQPVKLKSDMFNSEEIIQ